MGSQELESRMARLKCLLRSTAQVKPAPRPTLFPFVLDIGLLLSSAFPVSGLFSPSYLFSFRTSFFPSPVYLSIDSPDLYCASHTHT